MVVVVADAIFEASRGSGRLDAPDEALGDQHPEGVVHRLERDGPDLRPDDIGYGIGGNVGLTRDGAQDGQSLCRDLNAALTKKVSRVGQHMSSIAQSLEWLNGCRRGRRSRPCSGARVPARLHERSNCPDL